MARKGKRGPARDIAKRFRAPVTSATAQARQAIIQADVLGIAANRARVGGATKGTFGTRSLRAAGDISSYLLAPPVTMPDFTIPKPPKLPRIDRGGRRRPPPPGPQRRRRPPAPTQPRPPAPKPPPSRRRRRPPAPPPVPPREPPPPPRR